ncbi:MAG: heme-binding domain-containing protein [Vicingaceae bacterium]|nr:heme-binding domain-containing protein [Vicingaceae bacterium]
MLKKIGLALFAIFVIIQFFRIDKTNPEVIAENDFINVVNPPEEIAAIIKTSCYNCHSNTTQYPWYSNVAPISWWLKHHINEAREEELNFSEWETYNLAKKVNILKEAIEEVEEGEMPLSSYTIMHSESKLNADQVKTLIHFFETLKAEYEQEAQDFLNESTKEEDDDEPISNLKLNDGKKWIANPETITGINNMIAILGDPVEEERVILYVARGQQLMEEFKLLVSNCTMTGEAHDQLHNYILPLKEKIELLSNCEDTTACDFTSLDILRFLNDFNNYFEGESLPS